MQKHFLKFRKVFTTFACSPLLIISNNSELEAQYLLNEVEPSLKKLEINNINNGLSSGLDVELQRKKNIFIAEKKTNINGKVFLSQK